MIRRWRLRGLGSAALVAAVALALLVAGRASLGTLRARLDEVLPAEDAARVAAEVSDSYVAAAVVVLLLTALLGAVLGSALSQRLELLRARTRSRAGDDALRMPVSRIAELQGLGAAIDFLAAELGDRNAVLARDRHELALLVNGLSEGILQIDADARVVRANPAARTLLNLPEHGRGEAVTTLVRNTELRQLLSRAARGVATPAGEITIDERRVLVVSRPFSEGDARGTVVAFVDLTELRRLEGVRRDFVANVSHELKTPLTSIRGYVETLLTDELPPDVQRQFLEVVHTNADRLHHIVEDLLDLSRLESGGWRPEPHAVDVAALAREVWQAMTHRADAQALTFAVTGASLFARADPGGLRQVLTNLFDNAIRHTPAGGAITVHVRSTAAPAQEPVGWIVIEVQDTGSGIPRDALGRIFERFYRVDPARSRAEGGTGLGLSIVRHLAERMDGDVTAESELGKGTTIRVRLPAAARPGIVQQNAG